MALVIGIDEAGRGPIAGPVSVGVVAIEEGFDLLAAFPGLNDSKQLTEKKREVLFQILETEVEKGNVQFRVQLSSARMIDEKEFAGNTCSTRKRIASTLARSHGCGRKCEWKSLSRWHASRAIRVFTGNSDWRRWNYSCPSCSRRFRQSCSRQTNDAGNREAISAYHFEKHKGYGTKAHYEAITQHGLCDEHRRSFLKSFSVPT